MGDSLQDLDDKELYELLEKANLADRLLNDPAFKMLQEAADRIVERAINEFALKTKPDDVVNIIRLQTVIKKYKHGLFQEVKILKQESQFAYEEARERGIIGNFFESVKEKVGIS